MTEKYVMSILQKIKQKEIVLVRGCLVRNIYNQDVVVNDEVFTLNILHHITMSLYRLGPTFIRSWM